MSSDAAANKPLPTSVDPAGSRLPTCSRSFGGLQGRRPRRRRRQG